MSQLPQLPDKIQRQLVLQWEDLIEEQGFTGGHLSWNQSLDRLRRAAAPRITLAPRRWAAMSHTMERKVKRPESFSEPPELTCFLSRPE